MELTWHNKVDGIKDNCKVMGMGTGVKGYWKLCTAQNVDGSELEEVILHVQGIICKCELPPIRNPFYVYVIYFLTRSYTC